MRPARLIVPWSLVGLRLLLGPAIVALAAMRVSGSLLAMLVVLALLSDIYDGVLARRWNVDTPAIRLADSLVDTAFYLGTLGALWLRVPLILRRVLPLLVLLLILEAVRHVYDLYKFGKAASYHSYLAKTWGLVMAMAVVIVLWLGRGGGLLACSLLLGIASDVEGLAMSLVLPVWRHDVKTMSRALAIRRSYKRSP